MGIDFTADDIFALAEQIERNGAAFYRRAAQIAATPSVQKTFLELAEMEEGHEKLFASVRGLLQGKEKDSLTFDPNDDTARYLSEMASRHVFKQHSDVSTIFSGKETAMEVLDIAIGFERDSIAVFDAMERWVPEHLGRDKVAALVREEITHVAFLSREKEKLTRG
jgi:rubrerythrin